MKKIALMLAVLMMAMLFVSCGGAKTEEAASSDTTTVKSTDAVENEPKTAMDIITLKGPTGMGMAKLMADDEAGTSKFDYNFTVASAPDEVSPLILKGEFTVAAVPTNLAATLYSKTEGKIKIAAVNTLGVLYMVENGNAIQSVEDLRGKTICASGQGATPEYILRYILTENGIDPDNDVTIEYQAEHADVAAMLASGAATVALLPEPNVTSVLSSNTSLRIALDMTEEWEKVAEDGSGLAMGCIVVSSDFAENHADELEAFLDEYKASVDYVNENTEESSALIEKYGIVPKAALAKKALPNCNICCIEGDEMQELLDGFFGVLYSSNPASVGGKIPDEGIYYNK